MFEEAISGDELTDRCLREEEIINIIIDKTVLVFKNLFYRRRMRDKIDYFMDSILEYAVRLYTGRK